MQMTVAQATGAPPDIVNWKAIDWRKVHNDVRRLQVRIAEAAREKRSGKVRALQWILTHSWHAKLWAVRRVTTNKGAKTPGIDGVRWRSSKKKIEAAKALVRKGYKPQPLRRVYIRKLNGKLRPLGIPTMHDRAMQALYALALEPVAEALADPNSYGFRQRRSTADALGQVFIALAKSYSAEWVLDADIKGCFDQISHSWLIENIPMDTVVLRAWLKAGYIDRHMFHHTDTGTPQGGIISPILANMALDGLEDTIRQAVPKRGAKVNLIRYADDFVITGVSRKLIEETILPIVIDFLAQRGLVLSDEKTSITHIDTGFDFLGCNVRKYRGKLLIRPAKNKVTAFIRRTVEFIRSMRGSSAVILLRQLNAKLRGWSNYYRPFVSSETFSWVDYNIFHALRRWLRRRLGRKSWKWLTKRYYRFTGRRWLFSCSYRRADGTKHVLDLFRLAEANLYRHIKVQASAHAFDPDYDAYFARRKQGHRRRTRSECQFLSLYAS
ncbi:MAG: group II intron reverse transcriptase/maturase [bacterium]|nr:group II intron reverse transcriptase/maturase [bacterium]